MKVRVYDTEIKRFILSEVYAIVNAGYYGRYLLVVPRENGNYLKFFDYIDQLNPSPHNNVNIAIAISGTNNWVGKEGEALLKVKNALGSKQHIVKFDYFYGCPEIFDRSEVLAELLCGNVVNVEKINLPQADTFKGWNYIDKDIDIEKLMGMAASFHDAVLNGLNYISESYTGEIGFQIKNGSKGIIMHFSSCWCNDIELVFEGIIALNLRPSEENYSGEIYSATLKILEDKTIFFCDDDISERDAEKSDCTWIKAFSLRWRFRESIEKNSTKI